MIEAQSEITLMPVSTAEPDHDIVQRRKSRKFSTNAGQLQDS